MSKQIKTSELTGAALDWAVARCEGVVSELCSDGITLGFKLDGKLKVFTSGWSISYVPSRDWEQGGPIIEREKIQIRFVQECYWHFTTPTDTWTANYEGVGEWIGPTPLIAAMRCYVKSKLGDTVEAPDELLS